jgi:uncharacterized protein
VRTEFDPDKNELNVRRRGLSFEEVVHFDFETALIYADERGDYGERRYVALGRIGARVHVVCFTELADGIRVISFRKVNAREVARYAKVQALD